MDNDTAALMVIIELRQRVAELEARLARAEQAAAELQAQNE